MRPLVGGGVDLQPHLDSEQPLGAVTGPDQIVERRQQGGARHLARRLRARRQIRRLPPALDRDGRQLAGLDQFRHPLPRIGQRQAEIVAQVRRRCHAHGPRRDKHQLPLRFGLGRRRQVDDPRGQGAFGQVIDALETVARLRGDQPGPEQPLQRPLAVRPRPPAGRAARSGREVAAGHRSAPFDLGQHPFDIVGLLAPEAGQAGPHGPVLRPLHPPAQQRLQLQRQQRGLMPPVFEQPPPRPPGLGLQRLARIVPQPREAGQIVGAGDDVDAVDLDHAQPPGDVANMAPAGGGGLRAPEALGGQGDAAGGMRGEGFGHGTTMPLSLSHWERA